MKEFSMHILDIAQNSIRAEATRVEIEIREEIKENRFCFSVADDGKGMSRDFLKQVRDPFTTSRTTRKVGLGIPMLEQTCIQCGGSLEIESTPGTGTRILAAMEYHHIDRPPLGDMLNTLYILILMNPQVDFLYRHICNAKEYELDTIEIKEVLGSLPLDQPEVSAWLKEEIRDGLASVHPDSDNPLT